MDKKPRSELSEAEKGAELLSAYDALHAAIAEFNRIAANPESCTPEMKAAYDKIISAQWGITTLDLE